MIDVKWLIIVFLYVENEENGKSLFRRKRKSRTNYCPFDRKPHPDEEIKIRAHGPGKGRRNVVSVQEDKMITEY